MLKPQLLLLLEKFKKEKYFNMKKLFFAIITASVLVSCGLPAGGNKDVIKMEEGVERYDDAVGGSHGAKGSVANSEKKDVEIDLNGVALKGYANGLEESMVTFLKGGSYASATDETLKEKWYTFDHVNFKTGSTNQLESGAEQLDNLAKILKAYPDAKIKVGGYTDKTGKEEVNQKISQARAEFIKAELAKKGVGAQVVSAEGYGSKFATVPAEASDAERAADRKMAVRFTK